MSNKYKILVVEDETNIQNFIKTILETNGYQVLCDNSGSSGKTMFLSHCPNLVVLDLGLPDMDGLELIKAIREEFSTPIIILSARTNETDKVTALDFGANDYVTKPFGTNEFLARVRAALRSNRQEEGERQIGKFFTVNAMTIDYELRSVHLAEEEIKLTQTEYNIVELLSIHAGRVLTYSEIIKKIWGYADSGSIKKLQVNMANIRKKLHEKPGENKYIKNELGVGYSFKDEDKM